MTDTQRIAVVTGASSGIGKAAAAALAARGYRVIGVGRDPARTATAAAELGIEMLTADLSRMAQTARLARDIAARTDRIHLLINNAGGMAREKTITEEGLEENFASNHLGGFLLTERLLPLLRRAAADAPEGEVRILNTSSEASEMMALDLDDPQSLGSWNYGVSYCRAKLANVLHARGLAQRLARDGIAAHAMHPGFVASNFLSHAPAELQNRLRTQEPRTPEQGADTLVWLATSPEGGQTSGGYWQDRAPRTPHPSIDDQAAIDGLWTQSERLIAQAGV